MASGSDCEDPSASLLGRGRLCSRLCSRLSALCSRLCSLLASCCLWIRAFLCRLCLWCRGLCFGAPRPQGEVSIQVGVTGQTGGCEKDFLASVSQQLLGHGVRLKEYKGHRAGSGHFLLLFCPVSSRVGSDMKNALEGLQGEPKAVLVMLHHKPKGYSHFLDTSPQANHPAVVQTVHVRYTLDEGLYTCQENEAAVTVVAGVLRDRCKELQADPERGTAGV